MPVMTTLPAMPAALPLIDKQRGTSGWVKPWVRFCDGRVEQRGRGQHAAVAATAAGAKA